MNAADLPLVERVAELVHPDHPEHPAIFAERLGLAADGCWVLAAPGASALAGYAVTHPWSGRGAPLLDALLGAVPRPPRAWHIHDVALLPAARGAGRAASILRLVLRRATRAGCRRATLVALAGKAAYWRQWGFAPVAPADPAAVASYGPGAVFMARNLLQGRDLGTRVAMTRRPASRPPAPRPAGE